MFLKKPNPCLESEYKVNNKNMWDYSERLSTCCHSSSQPWQIFNQRQHEIWTIHTKLDCPWHFREGQGFWWVAIVFFTLWYSGYTRTVGSLHIHWLQITGQSPEQRKQLFFSFIPLTTPSDLTLAYRRLASLCKKFVLSAVYVFMHSCIQPFIF